MKTTLIFAFLATTRFISFAQATNTFPTSGSVGIGTTTPSARFEIASTSGHIMLSDTDEGGQLRIERDGGGLNVDLVSTNVNILRINDNGNIGIGTPTPADKLSVMGRIRSQEIKVETINWPDYVFAPSYKLPALHETEKFIKENLHLPGIPSAKEAENDGINLGEMNGKLLQKIEELTLYLIEMDKKVTNVQAENSQLKYEVNQLKSKQ